MIDGDTDFADLDTSPDIDEKPPVTETAPAPDIDDIDIQFTEGGTVEAPPEKPEVEEREPASSHLQREIRLKREARVRADALDAEVQRLNAENAALRQRSAAPGADDIDGEIEAKTKAFEKVRAEFDPEKAGEEARLIREIAALEYRKQAAAGGNGRAQPPQAQAQARHPRVQQWMDKNDWFGDPDYEKETRRARAIDAALYADGFRVEDGDYFEELERRMEAAGVKRPGGKRQNGGAQVKDSPVAGARADPPTGGKRSVTLTRDDLKFMATCGLDPKNKSHLKEFALNKLRDQRAST